MRWKTLVCNLGFRSVPKRITFTLSSHSFSHSHKQMVLPPMAKTRINLITHIPQKLARSSRHEEKLHTRRTICTNANTCRHDVRTQAADAHRRVSAAVNIILSTKWTFQSPFISLSSSSSLSLTFLLFHTQADTSPSSSSSLTHYPSWTHTDTYPETERWQGRGENTGSTLVIGLCRSPPSHPIRATLFHLFLTLLHL